EDRPGAELEELVALIVLGDHRRAEDVGGHEVGRELDAREVEVERLRDRAHEHGLAEAGHTLEQRVAAGDEAGEDSVEDVLLPDDHLSDLGTDPVDVALEGLNDLAGGLLLICHGCFLWDADSSRGRMSWK